jgi:proline iminopeptidase
MFCAYLLSTNVYKACKPVIEPPYRYPPRPPSDQGHLAVGDGHEVFYQCWGEPGKLPVLEVHGGPGVGTVDSYHRFFNPAHYRVIAFDQRGCGRSRPLGGLGNNCTQALIADMERLREHLGIECWIVTGWSWGATLALAYAEAHPVRVMALVLRAAWTARDHEASWFERGMQAFFPDLIDKLETPLPGVAPHERLADLFERAMDEGLPPALREQAARDYGRFELYACYLEATDEQVEHDLAQGPQLPVAVIGAHYWQHHWFLPEGQLWQDLPRITHLPCILIHGRYDMVTVPATAFELHRAWPGSELHIVPRAGHMSHEPGMVAAITDAMDRLANRFVAADDGV